MDRNARHMLAFVIVMLLFDHFRSSFCRLSPAIPDQAVVMIAANN